MIKTPLVALLQNEKHQYANPENKQSCKCYHKRCLPYSYNYLTDLQCLSFFNSNQLTYVQYVTKYSQNP